jgi:hypothetical protein
VPGKVVDGTFSLTEYEPGVSVLMEVDHWVGPIKPGGGYRLRAIDTGTRVEMEERVQLRGPLRLLRPLLTLAFRRSGRQVIRNLERCTAERTRGTATQ